MTYHSARDRLLAAAGWPGPSNVEFHEALSEFEQAIREEERAAHLSMGEELACYAAASARQAKTILGMHRTIEEHAQVYLCESLDQRLESLGQLVRNARLHTRLNQHEIALWYVRVIERVLSATIKEVQALIETMQEANR